MRQANFAMQSIAKTVVLPVNQACFIMDKSIKQIKNEVETNYFNSFLIKNAKYTDKHELPVIEPVDYVPERVVPFSKAKSSKWIDYDCWVTFNDSEIANEVFWNNPKKWLPLLGKFKGIIAPDFSMSIHGPWSQLFAQTFRERALAAWLQENGIPVIVNIRYANDASRDFCCEGVPCNSTISIGTLGALEDKEKRKAIVEGLEFIVSTLHPTVILVYGGCPEEIFGKYREKGIRIVHFKAQVTLAHEESQARKHRRMQDERDVIQGRLF